MISASRSALTNTLRTRQRGGGSSQAGRNGVLNGEDEKGTEQRGRGTSSFRFTEYGGPAPQLVRPVPQDSAWREDPQPYHVWLSEIMLQQTRVEAVKEYYSRFLRELPTIRDLAAAPEDKLLKLWEA